MHIFHENSLFVYLALLVEMCTCRRYAYDESQARIYRQGSWCAENKTGMKKKKQYSMSKYDIRFQIELC